jgi:hypothetical protein
VWPVDETVSFLLETMGGPPPDSPKTIHRYRPSQYLSDSWSLLNFRRARVMELMEMGLQDALNHDCEVSRCVLPGGTQGGEMPSVLSESELRVSEVMGTR